MSDSGASSHEEEFDMAAESKAAAAIKKNKWEDEDAEEEVKDDWEASESETEKVTETLVKQPKGPIRNKGITKMKIAEKEAEEQLKLAQQKALEEEENDPILKKKREQTRTIEADLENARGLFGDTAISKPSSSEDPLQMNPKTKADFEAMSTALSELIISKHGSKPLYPLFIEHFFRLLSEPLSDIQARKVGSILTTISNEKQRALKDSKKSGKGKQQKPTLVSGSGSGISKGGRGYGADLEVYDQALDDEFDDFM